MTIDQPRRSLIQAAAAVPLVALTRGARAQSSKLRVSTIPVMDTAPLQIAIAKGFFAAEGIEVDTTPTTGGAAGLPALAAGHVQVAFSNIISIVLAVKQGLDFQVITAANTTGDTPPDPAALLAMDETPISTGKDLEGKRLAVNTRNNIVWLYARAWVKATGGNPDAVTYLEVPFPQMVDALRSGRVDAAFAGQPFLSAALDTGKFKVIGWPYNEVQKRLPVAQYAASRAFIQQNPDLIARFARAYGKGADWANENRGTEEWARIVSAYTRLAPDKLKSIRLPSYPKTVDPSAIGQVVDLMRKNGLYEGPFDAHALLHKTAIAS
jgi:NitT/TauT family transport system substrate-binding protein